MTLEHRLLERGVSRRAFMKYCASLASLLALPPSASRALAETLQNTQRPSLIWLSFQECTGCSESLTRSFAPSIEELIFDLISLDYHETLFAAAGEAAEAARKAAMKDNHGKYLLAVDGSVSTKDGGLYSTVNGVSNLDTLREALPGAAAVISVGTCAAYGGIPAAAPNPTGAVPVADVLRQVAPNTPLVNIPGCPPIPVAITAVVAHYVTFGRLPDLDDKLRPRAFFGESIHDRCSRRGFYERGQFAKSFDDAGARAGYCLYELGCKGPVTYNACASVKWNDGTSFPIEAGHGCLGCSEPGFWDRGSFYAPLARAKWGQPGDLAKAGAVGAAVGLVALGLGRHAQNRARQAHHGQLQQQMQRAQEQMRRMQEQMQAQQDPGKGGER